MLQGHSDASWTMGDLLDEGAFGMSSGLVFLPGCWSRTSGGIALAKVVARHGGLYTSHIRGERETNIEATQELIETAERAGVRAQMPHMRCRTCRANGRSMATR